MSKPKIFQILNDIRGLKELDFRIIFTNGCFDILHAGHISLLKQAKAQGGILVVGLNTDESVRAIKGPTRPVNSWCDRAEMLEALECVDYVIGFEDLTPLELIKLIQPDVLVKGEDWENNVIGADFVKDYGGDVVIIPTVPGKSTTEILASTDSPITIHTVPVNPKTDEPWFSITSSGWSDNWSSCEPGPPPEWNLCEPGPEPEPKFQIKGKTFCFDIDGVIATIVPDNDYTKAKPINDNINLINYLHDNGAIIKLYTARGDSSGKDWEALTFRKLCEWGVKFTTIKYGKPSADYYIDDKMIGIRELTNLAGNYK